MKLISYNINNAKQSIRFTEPTLRVLKKSGLITFNSALIRFLGLNADDKIEFFKNEDVALNGPDRPGNWYFAKSEIGIPLRAHSKKNYDSLSLNSVIIARSILNDFQAAGYAISDKPLEYEGKKLYLILINKPLK